MMSQNKSRKGIVGWILSGLLVAFLVFGSASGKFTEWEGKQEMFAHLGWDEQRMVIIGVIEVLIAVLFLIPKVSFYGAVLLTAYLGGATATHVRVGDPYFMPIILGALVRVALALREPALFRLAKLDRS